MINNMKYLVNYKKYFYENHYKKVYRAYVLVVAVREVMQHLWWISLTRVISTVIVENTKKRVPNLVLFLFKCASPSFQ
jgi:hypothetical protein